ncbi:MAG: phosphotransferase [Phycisphaerales bacterium]|nr:phosphotransferase [Phycisphaerales bacterium]
MDAKPKATEDLQQTDSVASETVLETEEIASILSHYDIGEILSVRIYHRGSSRSPKALIDSGIGQLLLKRRGPGRDDPHRIFFEHAVHERLGSAGYPVAEIIRSARSQSAVMRSDSGIYELFRYVKASRCDGSHASLESCGESLAIMHDTLSGMDSNAPAVEGYHDSRKLTSALKRYAKKFDSAGRDCCQFILKSAVKAAAAVDSMGWSKWPRTVMHGDWHPGNVLYGDDGKVSLVLDFDAVRIDPHVSDLAAAVLHFGRYVACRERGDESTWPVQIDHDAAASIIKGYVSASNAEIIDGLILMVIPELMIEAVVMETMPPLIRDGRFSEYEAEEFLPIVADSISRIQQESGPLFHKMREVL